jgi:diaminopimelate decarboxylase
MSVAAGASAGDIVPSLLTGSFAVDRGELRIGAHGAAALVARHGSPLYVYDAETLRRRYRALRHALAGFADVFYSIKANPNPAVAAVLVEEGAGLEIASGAEFLLARKAGCAPDRILFAGPGKSPAELELAVAGGIGEVHLEGFEDIALAGHAAERFGRRVAVSIRVNPSAAARGGAMRMGGKPAAFGFDEELMGEAVAAIREQPQLDLHGIHLFAGTQILDADVLLTQWRHGLGLAAALADLAGRPLASIDLGGGLGIPYHVGDATLDLAALGEGARQLAAEVAQDPRLRRARILVEPGRYLAGPAGVYLMTVRAVKESRGQRFVITDGGMHHHLAASGNLGQVIKRDYPLLAATCRDGPARGQTFVVGPLCTPLDTLGRQTPLASVEPGDVIAVLQSGAYGLTSSPVGFLSHPMPAEVLIDGPLDRPVRARGSFERPLVNLG